MLNYVTPVSLLPFTPDTMRGFKQEIVVDLPAMMQGATKRELIKKLPELTQQGREMSYMAAFEALRMFRNMAEEQAANYNEQQKNQLAEFEVDWCLDILGRIQK